MVFVPSAVLPVVFFHAGLTSFGGGFVGVDIFFVISGYLIMSTIAADMARDRFTILGFYERRVRRIFPALFAMALFCAIVAAFVLPPNDFKQFGASLMAMAGFVSNLFFEFFGDQGGYFDTRWEPQLLLHTWSLSVEEQFYIFLPPGLLLLRKSTKARMRWSLIAVCAFSFVLSAIVVRLDAKVAFFLVLTRAWELMVGTLLALHMGPPLASRPVREGAAAIGLAMIAYAIFAFSPLTVFPGPSALLPCLGAVLIIFAGEAGPTLVGHMLSLRPIVFIGLISYSLYLWHWPLGRPRQADHARSPHTAVDRGCRDRLLRCRRPVVVVRRAAVPGPRRRSDPSSDSNGWRDRERRRAGPRPRRHDQPGPAATLRSGDARDPRDELPAPIRYPQRPLHELAEGRSPNR